MVIDENMRKMVSGSQEDVALALNEGIVGAFIAEAGKTKFMKTYQVISVPVSDTERRLIIADSDADMSKIDVQVIFHKALIGDKFVVIRENGMIGSQLFKEE